MLIQCSGCDAKISVPATAVGKRVQCPKCQRVIRVPPPEDAPKPKPSENVEPATSAPEKPADPEAFSSKPPPVSKSKAAWDDDEKKDEEKDDRPPKKRRRNDYDDDDDDRDDDEDDEDLDVRKRRRKNIRRRPVDGMAMTSMVMGVVAAAFGVPGCLGCCCHIDTAVAFICGLIAVILGHMSRSSAGSSGETYSLTGLICGYIGIGLAALGVLLFILQITLRVGMLNN